MSLTSRISRCSSSVHLVTIIAVVAAAIVACSSNSASSVAPGPDAGAAAPAPTTTAPPPVSSPTSCTDVAVPMQGRLTQSRTLLKGCFYRLTGDTSLSGEGVELTLEPGVVIDAAGPFFLRVEDGARLVVKGTETEPVTLRAATSIVEQGWQGLRLGGGPRGVRHDLHWLRVRGAGRVPLEDDDATPSLAVLGDGVTTEVLLDHVTIEDAKHGGLQLSGSGARLAADSTALEVRNGGGYPVIVDAIHVAQLPPRLALQSKTPDRGRILVFGGKDGVLAGDHTWPVQTAAYELAVSLTIGTETRPSSLTIEPPATVTLRAGASLRATNGKIVAKSTEEARIGFDWAETSKYWGSIVLTADETSTLAHDSVFEGVAFRHGGAGDAPMLRIVGPGAPGTAGDCTAGATITRSTFSERSPDHTGSSALCLEATDHTNAYATDNVFVGCAPSVACD